MIAREHGSWAVIGVPLVLAGILGREWFPWLLVFGVSALAVFMSYVPVQFLLHRGGASRPDERRRAVRWAVFYLSVGCASSLPLILGGRPVLAVFGIAAVVVFLLKHLLTRHAPRTVPGDIAAVAGLTLTGPAGLYAATGSLGPDIWLLWVLCFGFFTGTILHVHMKIAARQRIDHRLPLSERFKLGKTNLLYQSSALGSVSALAAAGVLPWATLAAYVPMAAQGLYGTVRLNRNMKFKNLGLALLAQSLLFGSALAMAL